MKRSANHPAILSTCALALCLGACVTDDGDPAADDDAADETSTATPATDESSGEAGDSTTGSIDALFDCDDAMLTPIGPLVGPGYDEAMGGLLEPVAATYVISTTMALPYDDKVQDFLDMSGQVEAATAEAGVVAVQLAFEPQCGFFRTLTVWRSPGEMAAFVASPVHAMAIQRSSELVLAGKVTHWELAADEFPPTWDMAKAELVAVSPFGGGY